MIGLFCPIDYLNGNSSKVSETGYSIIDISEAGDITYEVYDFKGVKIDAQKLPSKIISNNNVVIRRDDEYAR